MLVSQMLSEAKAAGRGVAALNVMHLETAEAVVAAAEASGHPVILQISENCVGYHGGLKPFASAVRALISESSAQLALHLDHAESLPLVEEALALGFDSVMFDGSQLPDDENIARTRHVVELARDRGVFVEAELGAIGGKGRAHDPGVVTDPLEAAAFVDATGVDALAVAVGSSHAMADRTAAIDLERVAAIAAHVSIPLVLHGSSGVPDELLVAGVRAGLTKINLATQLNRVFTAEVRRHLGEHTDVVDSRKYLAAGRIAVQQEAARIISLLSDVAKE